MEIPSEITTLVERLNQELERTEREASEGVNLLRFLLSRFPDNIRLIQFLAFFNNGLLFVEISRRQIQLILDRLSMPDVTNEEIEEAGEDLGSLLGRVLEAKIRARYILDILEEIQ